MAFGQSVEDRLSSSLQGFLGAHGRVERLRPMEDGHAGLTFGFDLVSGDGKSAPYILKKSPEGVPRRGSADVFRQAALLRVLGKSGFPAPGVPWASEADDILGAPFIVMDRLPGRTFIPWAPAPDMLAQLNDPSIVWTETARLMGALHRFDWRGGLSGWEEPTDLVREVQRWTRLLRHMQDPDQLILAQRLATRLEETLPSSAAIGLTHGDLQPGNVLFDGPVASGLIDWDLAAIGPIGLDVGWMLMMADAESWAPDWRPLGTPPRAALLETYWTAYGARIGDLTWFHAFANFRLAAITGLNFKLHRDGRRHDPIWERFASAVPHLLGRALAMLTHTEEDIS